MLVKYNLNSPVMSLQMVNKAEIKCCRNYYIPSI